MQSEGNLKTNRNSPRTGTHLFQCKTKYRVLGLYFETSVDKKFKKRTWEESVKRGVFLKSVTSMFYTSDCTRPI